MKKISCFRGGGSADVKSFTLVEMLVAISVFLILVFLVMEVTLGIMQTAVSQKKQMDSLGEARQSFDRLGLDWAARVRRSDVRSAITNQTIANETTTLDGNDQLGFLTQVASTNSGAGARRLSWVDYQVTPVANQTNAPWSALQRGIVGYYWTNSAGTPVLSLPMTNYSPATNSTMDVEPMDNTVFRFKVCFLRSPLWYGTTTPNLTNFTYPAGFTTNTTGFSDATNTMVDLTSTNLVGVVVTVAVLDAQSQKIITPTQLTALAAALPDPPDLGGNQLLVQDPQSAWVQAINDTNTPLYQAAGVPKSVAASVRVYQRIFYVNE